MPSSIEAYSCLPSSQVIATSLASSSPNPTTRVAVRPRVGGRAADDASAEERQRQDWQKRGRQGTSLVEERREAKRREKGAKDEDRRHESRADGAGQQECGGHVECEPGQQDLPPDLST
jgi:hypothetical protein